MKERQEDAQKRYNRVNYSQMTPEEKANYWRSLEKLAEVVEIPPKTGQG